MPDELDNAPELMKKLDAICLAASVAMGISRTVEEAARKSAVPFIGFVSVPQSARLLTGDVLEAESIDLTARMLSNGQAHRALPLTTALCLAAAAAIEGTVVNDLSRKSGIQNAQLRIGMPSGVLTVGAAVKERDGIWHADQGAFYRTQRRLFEGNVLMRASRISTAL